MKKNDANNLRRPAVDLLVKLLPEESKAGIWTFGQYVNMLVPHGTVDEKWRKLASEKTSRINSNGLYTNIGEVLEKAAYDIGRVSKDNSSVPTVYKHLILLTDGMVDISKDPNENEIEWRRISDEILPALKESNYKIHTIALSDNADTELLNKLSLATDGVAAIANDADELMKIFLNALDSAAPPEQVPLKGNSFVVDSSVEEFTALVFPTEGSPPTRLQSPENIEYVFEKKREDVNWFRTDKYDLLTIKRPVEGEWKLLAELDQDSRVTIVSDLNLIVKPINNNALKGELIDLTLLLEEDGNKVVRQDLLKIIDVSYSVQRHNDGEAWFDVIPADLTLSASEPKAGIFSISLDIFDKVGIYEIKVVVDGKSFKREFSHSIEIRDPFIVETETQKKDSVTHIVTRVTASNDDIDISKTSMVAGIRYPSGNSTVKPLKLTDFDSWELDFNPIEQGVYQIDLKVNAVNKKGEAFEFSPETIRVKYPEDGDFFAEPKKEEVKNEPAVKKPSKDIEDAPSNLEEESEEPKSKLWLYVGLGVGNLLILILAFFAYRMVMGNKVDDELEDLEKSLEENQQDESKETTKAESEEVLAGDKTESSEKPQEKEIDELSGENDQAKEKQVKRDEKNETESKPPNMTEVEPASETKVTETEKETVLESTEMESFDLGAEDDGVEGITDVEFSLDDFEEDEDDLDSEIDRELAGELEESSKSESENSNEVKEKEDQATDNKSSQSVENTQTLETSPAPEKDDVKKDEFDLSAVEESSDSGKAIDDVSDSEKDNDNIDKEKK
ncbi:MAG: VWA domain-containing protein [Cellvibrionaceae bacterium]